MSKLVAERGGYDLLPEMGYRPVNKYLPPRAFGPAAPPEAAKPLEPLPPAGNAMTDRFFAWVDRALSGPRR